MIARINLDNIFKAPSSVPDTELAPKLVSFPSPETPIQPLTIPMGILIRQITYQLSEGPVLSLSTFYLLNCASCGL